MSYLKVCEEVDREMAILGRKRDEVMIIAVSKTRTILEMQEVYNQGCRHFGESRTQEFLLKKDQMPQDIFWHFVGTLQKNKVSKVSGKCSLIHSVDSLDLAKKITLTPVLLEVNTSLEPTKHGLTEEGWEEILEEVFQLPNLQILGLMTMAPLTSDEKRIRSCFAKLHSLQEKWRKRLANPSILPHLSMGMSHDFRFALKEGATLLRIGSAIFISS